VHREGGETWKAVMGVEIWDQKETHGRVAKRRQDECRRSKTFGTEELPKKDEDQNLCSSVNVDEKKRRVEWEKKFDE